MEIEIKAKLRDADEVMEKLKALGCEFSEPRTQDDTVFVEKLGDLQTFLSNDVFPRIRIEDGSRVILTVKKPMIKSAEMLIKHEYEVVVDSADEAHGMLELLGFQPAVRTIKKRRTAHYQNYEICIDEIEHLGTFIELESMGGEKEARDIQRAMWKFLESLGISLVDQITKGYDILMLEHL